MSGAIINSGGHPKMPQAVMPPSLPSPPPQPPPPSSLLKELGTPLSTRSSHSARPLSTILLCLPETFCILYCPSNVSISTSITVILLLMSSVSTYDWSHFTASRFLSCIYVHKYHHIGYSLLIYFVVFLAQENSSRDTSLRHRIILIFEITAYWPTLSC